MQNINKAIFFLIGNVEVIYGSGHEISNDVVCVTSKKKGSDQPVLTCSLIRDFATHLNILSLLSY